MSVELVEDYWIDSNNNKWYFGKYTREQAIKVSQTLINCKDCIDCVDCINCINCFQCTYCENCINCDVSVGCIECKYC